jgi:S-adenosylmethionine:tRNA ribosyltransferase-isomerase
VSALEVAAPLEAREPPEVRGSGREDVAVLVATRHDGVLRHARFGDLPDFLSAGDLLVVNTSATLPAALDARLDGLELELRLSTPAPGGGDAHWVVELRSPGLAGAEPFMRPPPGARIDLAGGAHAELLAPYAGGRRLALARLALGEPVEDFLNEHGSPIRYRHVPDAWPLEAYQTVFAREPGSAEMPSAGRPFTAELVTELVAGGVLVAPVLLHTGVSSLERGEAPYPERYRVPPATARLVNAVRGWGGRVVAVGTTVVRALETVAGPDGSVAAGEGWTGLVVTAQRGLRAVDGLLTGWHEPDGSHRQLVEAVAGRELLERSEREARGHDHLWHEFGDVHLILP